MAESMITGLAQRLGGWLDEAERRGRPQARRAARDGRATLEELRGLWDRIEDLVERDVAPWASRQAGQAGETASGLAHRAEKTASRSADRAEKTVSDYAHRAGDRVSDYAHRAGDRVSDFTHRAGDRVSDYAHRAGGTVSEFTHRAGEQAYDGIRDAVVRYGPRARAAAGGALGHARDAAMARPLTTLAIGLAGTWLVASLLSARRR